MPKKLTQEEVIQRFVAVHGDRYDYSQVRYVNKDTKVEIICPEHGSFFCTPHNHSKGRGCPECAHNAPMDQEKFLAKAREVHGDRYDYSEAMYRRGCDKVVIICPVHGRFEQTANSHLMGHGCKACHYESGQSEETKKARAASIRATCLERYGVSNPMKLEEVLNIYEMRYRAAHGVSNPMQDSDVVERSLASKRVNGSFNTSAPEDKLYTLLCDAFGAEDIKRQYVDVKRYPFSCDFYVTSLDVFIEANFHWTHGGHWFDTASQEDVEKVAFWSARTETNRDYYANALRVWTERDPMKHAFAQQHDLNYVVLWDTHLEDTYLWFELGCPAKFDVCSICS